MIKYLKAILRARYGGLQHQRAHSAMLTAIPSVSDAIQSANSRWAPLVNSGSEGRPVFLLASSWRAGSTALQRLVMSRDSVIIWGEPYRNCNYVQALSESLTSFTDKHPGEKELTLAGGGLDLSTEWIATMSPPPEDLKAAHWAFFDRLYDVPAGDLGYSRWGLKEVRLDIGHARYLRWLFPKARFVFLYRDPYAAYRSYRAFPTWYAEWPRSPVLSATQFAQHWRRLTEGFLSDREFDAYRLSYEDLQSRPSEVAEDLSRYLDLPISAEALTHRVTGRGVHKDRTRPPVVPRPELSAVHRVAGDLASELGYRPES